MPSPTRVKTILSLFLFSMLGVSLFGQDPASSPAWKRAKHLQHGINASEWFAQSSDYSVQRLSTYTTLDDIALMHRLGFDHVRLSIDPEIFDCAGAWSDCPRIKILDSVVAQALQQNLAVIIDVHPTSEFKHQLATDGFAVERFRMLWGRIAEHFRTSDPERTFFEVLNEPELRDPYRWSGIQEIVVAEIRRMAPKHTVIVAGAEYSDIGDLIVVPAIRDDNLIYNFHYYEPHLFTHQGASWGVPFWLDLRDVPYPATPESVAPAIAEQSNDTARWELTELGLAHWDLPRINAEMQFAADWAKKRQTPLICNEFGVYRNFAHREDRLRWVHDVRTALEQNGIGWTMWDYRGGFGVVTKKAGSTTPDEELLRALGLAQDR